jgi:alpha-D-ribose 1-methylphosphonate 5-triphosphate synthase subunit PhnH
MGLRPGFADPVLDSQRAFRSVLHAMSHPGRIVALPAVDAPPPVGVAAAAVCLALLDLDTPLWLDAAARGPDVVAWLRFHCGAPIVDDTRSARFALVADAVTMPPLEAFDAGTDERPDVSATLVLQVAGLAAGHGGWLRGPGIERESRLAVTGGPPDFWNAARANGARFPRGVDLIVCAFDRLVALPRTTRVEA